MAVSQTNIKDFGTIFMVGAFVGAGALFVFNQISSIKTTAGTLTKPPGLSPSTDVPALSKYGDYDTDPGYLSAASYAWDFRNPYVGGEENVLYNKAPFIELQSTSDFDPNNPKFAGSYTGCGLCTQ